MAYELALGKVSALLAGITTTKPSSDVVVMRRLFEALSSVEDAAAGPTVDGAVLVANANLAALEDVVCGKTVLLSRCLQTLLVSIYSCIVAKAPGYAVRNIASTYLALSASKAAPTCSRECSVHVLGLIFATRAFDCGSLITDAAAGLTKLAKGSDVRLRVAALKALFSMVSGAGTRMGDCHAELVKLAGKCASDRSVEVRLTTAALVAAVAKASAGCTTVPSEALLGAVGKGVEDDVAAVQDAFCRAVAAVHAEQIRAQLDAEEQAKIGLARGVSAQTEQLPKPKRRLISKIASAMKHAIEEKKPVEDYKFRSVVAHLLRNIVKAGTGAARAAQVAVLLHLTQECVALEQMDGQSDLDWLVGSLVGLTNDPMFSALPYDEQLYLRARLSHLFRAAVTSQLPEGRLAALATFLTQYVSRLDIDLDAKVAEHELQFALGELSHVVTSLGEAAVAVADVAQAAATVHLRHPVFGVRSAAAHVLVSIATTLPARGPVGLRASLSSAQMQARQLAAYDGGDDSSSKAAREQERLQRMYFFHGHTLVMSLFLRHEKNLASSLPQQLILDVLDFGLELLTQVGVAVAAGLDVSRTSSLPPPTALPQGKIKSLESIYLFSLPIKEYQIVDHFLGPALKDEVMKIMPVQKQTRAGQRTRFKAFVAVGDYDGHVGLGVKCAKEVATAIRGAIIDAKMSVVPVRRGYWGNKIGKPHTVPTKLQGKCGSVCVRLVPAPRGAGIVAARVPKKLLQMSGVSDVYTCSRGSTKTLGNFVMATFNAIAKSYSYLTPDLWRETKLVKPPNQEHTDFLGKPQKIEPEEKIGGYSRGMHVYGRGVGGAYAYAHACPLPFRLCADIDHASGLHF